MELVRVGRGVWETGVTEGEAPNESDAEAEDEGGGDSDAEEEGGKNCAVRDVEMDCTSPADRA